MRKSNIAVLAAVGFVLLLMVVAMAGARVMMDRSGLLGDRRELAAVEATGFTVEEVEDLDGFNALEISGNWNVTVERGDDWSVSIRYPDGYDDRVDARVRGDVLVLDVREKNDSMEAVMADIVMPEFAGLETAGASDVDFAGFSGESLDLRIVGGAKIKGGDGRYETLSLRTEGATKVDLLNLDVVDADLRINGASDVTVFMDGGVLTGELAGVGSVKYAGFVREQKIQVSGLGKVKKVG